MFQILIVEDDKELSQLFQKVLEKNGYQDFLHPVQNLPNTSKSSADDTSESDEMSVLPP